MNQLTLSTDVNTGQLTVTDDPFSGNTTLPIDPIYASSKAKDYSLIDSLYRQILYVSDTVHG